MKPFDKEILPVIQEQPHNRSAYSHITSYELAGISVLVYKIFETELDIESTLESISAIINAKKVDINSLNLKSATTEKLNTIVDSLTETEKLNTIVDSLTEQELANALNTKPTNKKEIEDGLSKMGWELKETISVSNNICDTQAIIAQKENQVALVFRGTEKAKDVITCLSFIKKQTARGEVHSGFHNAYQEAKHQIITKLRNTIGENKNIQLFVAGHSLGGALAAIATRDIELHTSFRENLAACYTYGCPRYGTYEFISKLKTPIYRIVNHNDFAVKLPPSGGFVTILIKALEKFPPLSFLKNARFLIQKHIGGYTHCGTPYFLSKTHKKCHEDIKIRHHRSVWKRILSLMISIFAISMFMHLVSIMTPTLVSIYVMVQAITLKLISLPIILKLISLPIILKLILLPIIISISLLLISVLLSLISILLLLIISILKFLSLKILAFIGRIKLFMHTSDHSKINYRDKLEAYANKKNSRIP